MEKDTNAHQPSATSGREPLPEHVLRTRREFVDLVAKIVAKVKDVAFKCGFDETSPFSKAFKKWSGYGPLAFRKQKRIEESEDWVRLLEKYK